MSDLVEVTIAGQVRLQDLSPETRAAIERETGEVLARSVREGMWTVTMEPVSRGVVVHVTDGRVKSVVGRVAWSAWDSSHPLRALRRGPFRGRLLVVLARAMEQAALFNGQDRGEAT